MFYCRIDSCYLSPSIPTSVSFASLLFLTLKVVSFFSLRYDTAPTWMVLAVLWCSMVQTLLLPSFIWSCERYRADLRTVWEQCVAIMSEEDTEDGKPLTSPQSPCFTNHLPKRLQSKEGVFGRRIWWCCRWFSDIRVAAWSQQPRENLFCRRLCHSLAALRTSIQEALVQHPPH